MAGSSGRTPEEVTRLKLERNSGRWRWIRWVHRRRPLLTAVIVVAALLHSVIRREVPADLLNPGSSWRFWVAWSLLIFGLVIRVWGSGNLQKNQEITQRGVYQAVRHPLYLGSLSLFAAYFLTIGDPWMGMGYFAALVGLVYHPTMLAEEEHLMLTFPHQFAKYRPPPRLVPDPRRLIAGIRNDGFDFRSAYHNLGLRSAWFLLVLPILLEIVARVRTL